MSGEVPVGDGPVAVVPPVRTGPAALDWIVVAWLTVLVLVTTVFAVFFLPQYVGVVPVPISVVPAALVVFAAIRLSYRLTGSMLAAFAPAVAWLVAAVYLSFSRTFGYALVIGDWRATLLLGVGALAAAVGVGLCWGSHQLALVGQARDSGSSGVPGVTSGSGSGVR